MHVFEHTQTPSETNVFLEQFACCSKQPGLHWSELTRTWMGHWQVEVTAVRFGDVWLDGFCKDKCYAFLDSGTTTLGFSKKGKQAFNDLVSVHLENHDIAVETEILPGKRGQAGRACHQNLY